MKARAAIIAAPLDARLLDLMRFDATYQLELLDQPQLMIAGEQADTLYMTEQAHRHPGQGTVHHPEGHAHRYLLGPRYVDAALSKHTMF